MQFPPDVANRYVLLLDPMLGALEVPGPYLNLLSHVLSATGGSAIKAVEVLMEHGVPEERIIFVNLVSESPLHVTPGNLLLGWTLLDLRPRRSQSLLQQVPSITCGTLFTPVRSHNQPCYIQQITGWIDKCLNEKAYIIPGLGDFGERR